LHDAWETVYGKAKEDGADIIYG